MADLKIGVVGIPGKWSTETLADSVEEKTGFRLVIDMNEVNLDLESSPELVNESPYDQGWMIVIEASNAAEFNELLSATDYRSYVEESAES